MVYEAFAVGRCDRNAGDDGAAALLAIDRDAARKLGRAVGLFGAIELRNINGPVLVEHPYRVTGSIVALGQSPKTEYMWFETALDEKAGKRIAEMRMLLRFMKASSPKYQDAIAS